MTISSTQYAANAERIRKNHVRGHAADGIGDGWHNHCREFARTAAGAPGKNGVAIGLWDEAGPEHRFTSWPPPVGVPYVFRNGGAGHVVPIIGKQGLCDSTDIERIGYISTATVNSIAADWNLRKVGWITKINGVIISLTSVPTPPKPPLGSSVSLSHLKHAAQGHLHSQDVQVVKMWLHAEGLLKVWWRGEGWGNTTTAAYKEWQRSKAGGDYRGSAADGIPGVKSLTALAHRHGGSVTA